MELVSYLLGKNSSGGSTPTGPELFVKAGDSYYKTNGAYYLAQNLDKALVDDTSMDYVFYNCAMLSSIPKLYSTKKITSAINAFGFCNGVGTLDLSGITWADSNININSMFYGCDELDVLDISSLDFRNVTTSNAETFECGSWAELSMGGYAEGIPYVYVKDAYAQQKVIEIASQKQLGGTWTTSNVVIKGSN